MINFIFIGPSKTASTWIHRFLEQADGVFVPPEKDLYFFDQFYGRGVDWYHSFFAKADQSMLCGEVCHDYFTDLNALQRIFEYNPSVKLLVSLRNPYERAVSSVKYHYRTGYTGDVLDLLKNDNTILNESLYGRHLSRVFSIFPRENVKVLYFSDLSENYLKFSNEMLDFLGVPSGDRPAFDSAVVNAAAVPRVAVLAKISRKIMQLLRYFRLNSLAGLLKRNRFLIKVLFKSSASDKRENLITQSVSRYLFSDVENDLDDLEVLLKRSFDGWRLRDHQQERGQK